MENSNFECNGGEIFVPDEVLNEANEAAGRVIPTKSKTLYEKEYSLFCEWRNKKKARGVDEKIVLAYISERSKNVKSSSLWAYYSQLKKMLSVKENVDISRFYQVKAFLKQNSVGHRPKKSKVFTREDLEKFLDTAPDDKYLLLKVVFIVGIAGGCRIGELVGMSVDDVDDRGSVLVIQIPDSKTYKQRVFTVVNGGNTVHALDIFRKYRNLRPGKVAHKRLFLYYRDDKCTVQPVGLNTFSKMPHKIAEFLNLPNAEEYTGHSFRRSSATLQADAGADLTVLKRHGGWRSSSVAEGYIEDSLQNKINISNKILSGGDQRECGVSGVTMAVTSTCTSTSTCTAEKTIQINNGGSKTNSVSDVTAEKLSIPSLDAGQQFNFSNLKDCKFYFNCK